MKRSRGGINVHTPRRQREMPNRKFQVPRFNEDDYGGPTNCRPQQPENTYVHSATSTDSGYYSPDGDRPNFYHTQQQQSVLSPPQINQMYSSTLQVQSPGPQIPSACSPFLFSPIQGMPPQQMYTPSPPPPQLPQNFELQQMLIQPPPIQPNLLPETHAASSPPSQFYHSKTYVNPSPPPRMYPHTIPDALYSNLGVPKQPLISPPQNTNQIAEPQVVEHIQFEELDLVMRLDGYSDEDLAKLYKEWIAKRVHIRKDQKTELKIFLKRIKVELEARKMMIERQMKRKKQEGEPDAWKSEESSL